MCTRREIVRSKFTQVHCALVGVCGPDGAGDVQTRDSAAGVTDELS